MTLFYKSINFLARKTAALPVRIAGPLRQSIAFIHLPKCGGTSLHQGISQHYPSGSVTYLDPAASRIAAQKDGLAMLPARRSILAYELAKRNSHRFISGHWPVDRDLIDHHHEHWSFVTLLRDPVDRWFSNYFFNRHRQGGREHFGTEHSLEEYLQTKDAVENGKLYLSFCLGGTMPTGDLSSAIETAIAVLNKFALVGTLDKMDDFLDQFEALWGVRPAIPNSNKNPATEHQQNEAITPSIRRQVEHLCLPDRAIYDALHTQT